MARVSWRFQVEGVLILSVEIENLCKTLHPELPLVFILGIQCILSRHRAHGKLLVKFQILVVLDLIGTEVDLLHRDNISEAQISVSRGSSE